MPTTLPRSLRPGLAAAAVASSLAIAACGGGGSGSTATSSSVPVNAPAPVTSAGGGTALSRSELVGKLNAICTHGAKDAKAITTPTNLTDPKELAAYLDALAPLSEKETAEMARLKPSSEVADDFGALLSAQHEATAKLSAIQKQAAAGDPRALDGFAGIASTTTRLHDAAVRIGNLDCGV